MNVALISGAYPRREVVARGVSHKLNGGTVRAFSCIEDVLESSMEYTVFVVYNNFDKKMNGVDGTREIRRRAPRSYIVGVSAIPYMERQYIPAGADAFLLLAGNEIAELGDLLVRNQARIDAKAMGVIPVGAASAPEVTPSEMAPVPSQPREEIDPLLTTDHMIYVLERARLLLDYAIGTPDPADLRRYSKTMMTEIERVITRYYETHPHSDNGRRSK